jgi:hypothetical protein
VHKIRCGCGKSEELLQNITGYQGKAKFQVYIQLIQIKDVSDVWQADIRGYIQSVLYS